MADSITKVEESISVDLTEVAVDPIPSPVVAEKSSAKSAVGVAAKAVASILLDSSPFISFQFTRSKGEGSRKTREERKSDLVKELVVAGIDPLVFDSLLTNELDRRLKIRFGVAFLALTSVFTAVSYAIIVFAGIYNWNIPSLALTGLIIETPIQFIGLLYIIARNLFPDGRGKIRSVVRQKRSASKTIKENSD